MFIVLIVIALFFFFLSNLKYKRMRTLSGTGYAHAIDKTHFLHNLFFGIGISMLLLVIIFQFYFNY